MSSPFTHTEIPLDYDPNGRVLPTPGIGHYHCGLCRRAVRDGANCSRCIGAGDRIPTMTMTTTITQGMDIEVGHYIRIDQDARTFEVVNRRVDACDQGGRVTFEMIPLDESHPLQIANEIAGLMGIPSTILDGKQGGSYDLADTMARSYFPGLSQDNPGTGTGHATAPENVDDERS